MAAQVPLQQRKPQHRKINPHKSTKSIKQIQQDLKLQHLTGHSRELMVCDSPLKRPKGAARGENEKSKPQKSRNPSHRTFDSCVVESDDDGDRDGGGDERREAEAEAEEIEEEEEGEGGGERES
ncbi:hypothetical protein Droror1_Dr00013621 [Drosera rotundifolia]